MLLSSTTQNKEKTSRVRWVWGLGPVGYRLYRLWRGLGARGFGSARKQAFSSSRVTPPRQFVKQHAACQGNKVKDLQSTGSCSGILRVPVQGSFKDLGFWEDSCTGCTPVEQPGLHKTPCNPIKPDPPARFSTEPSTLNQHPQTQTPKPLNPNPNPKSYKAGNRAYLPLYRKSSKAPTWRFTGSYRSGYKSGNNTYNITHIRGLITPLLTTREPPSNQPRKKPPLRRRPVQRLRRHRPWSPQESNTVRYEKLPRVLVYLIAYLFVSTLNACMCILHAYMHRMGLWV